MITLRLFKAADPFREIDTRVLNAGAITLGRDASADWRLDDARGDISRRHCTISTYADAIYVRDHSTNGVTTGTSRTRVPQNLDHQIAPGETLHLGEFMLVVDRPGQDDIDATMARRPVQTDEAASRGAPYSGTEASLLEAFCAGAGLEAGSFIGEDPSGLMGRLGMLYRQVVDDLSKLLDDRAALKDTLQIDRTTICGRDNNPLKWAGPEQVARDLLRESDAGFLNGSDAIREAFEDLRRHNASVLAGSTAALEYVLRELSPGTIETAQPRAQHLAFLPRGESNWKKYLARHQTLTAEFRLTGSGRIGHAARQAYQVALAPAHADKAD
jgi:predicted component of type VI protein secretion system